MRKNIITVTKNALKKMNCILQKSNNKNFLFGINSGGCNGFNYNLQLIENTKLDIKQQTNNKYVKLYIEPISELYLVGLEIDFLEEDYNKGIFESKFIYNAHKNMTSICGCGVYFTPTFLMEPKKYLLYFAYVL